MRRAVLLVVVAAVVAAGIWLFPHVRDRVTLQLLQRRCMKHAPSGNEFVYHEAGGWHGLLYDRRYQMRGGPRPAAFLVTRDWRELYVRLSPPGFRSDGTVFLGEMKTPDGDRRLVAVDMVIDSSSEVLLTARVVEPGSLLRRPRLATASIYRLRSDALLAEPVTPGKVDPRDPARVLLFGGRVEGWLRDDTVNGSLCNDHVELYPRDLTPPAPSSPASLPTSAGPATRPWAPPAGK